VSGVVDGTKAPLPGTSILVKGTTEHQQMLMENIPYLQLSEMFYNSLFESKV
jgi:hypothetical protein